MLLLVLLFVTRDSYSTACGGGARGAKGEERQGKRAERRLGIHLLPATEGMSQVNKALTPPQETELQLSILRIMLSILPIMLSVLPILLRILPIMLHILLIMLSILLIMLHGHP